MLGTSEPRLHLVSKALTEQVKSITASVSPDRLKQHVQNLNYPRNRLHSPEDMKRAEEYIASLFQESGWQTKQLPYTLKEVKGNLDYGNYDSTTYPELSGVNIVAIKPGQEPSNALIIEAHYDTVWMSPGADDNTASVAVLLELARILDPYKFKQTVILACCDMEEIGLLGATELIKQLSPDYDIKGAIILETLAYTSKQPNSQSVPPRFGLIYPDQAKRLKKRNYVGDNTIIIYHNNAKSLAVRFGESMANIAGADSVMLIQAPGDIPVLGRLLRTFFYQLIRQFYRANHYPFLMAGIPAIQITDSANFRNPHYHKPKDTADTLDYECLACIAESTLIMIIGQ
jgi:Zn-dependent M28 family amino/carboxypeptidase